MREDEIVQGKVIFGVTKKHEISISISPIEQIFASVPPDIDNSWVPLSG